MSRTWSDLKTAVRERVFPEGEPTRLIAAHDKMFVDAIVDLQTWVECLQHDHTDPFPQCSTFYRCGLTVLDAPRGHVLKLSVIDKIDPTTHRESATADDDYCSEITYHQIEACHIQNYFRHSFTRSCCLPLLPFFGLWPSCSPRYPTPTDAGLPPGLLPLPLGFHYPQGSTDRTNGIRSRGGVWAIERGKIYVAPWIQSTETIILKWDGIKRRWSDGDPIDDDPVIEEAISEYVRWKHEAKYGHDQEVAGEAQSSYITARQNLIHECIEETRVRECENSQARSSSGTITSLYYNDAAGEGHASCPAGTTGADTVARREIGSVSSPISIADANRIAQELAQADAEAQLDCSSTPATYTNTVAGDYTAVCEGETDAPPVTGDPVRVVKNIGTVTSTVSTADANTRAQQLAHDEAIAALAGHCTYRNRAKTATAVCSYNSGITGTGSVGEGEFTSTVSQTDADTQAQAEAQSRAQEALDDLGTCTQAAAGVWNTAQEGLTTLNCDPIGIIQIHWHVPVGYVKRNDQGTANNDARNIAMVVAQQIAIQRCLMHQLGHYDFNLPQSPIYVP